MEYAIFGCRLNKYYLNQWLSYFRNHTFSHAPFLITTCEVTDRAKQKWIKLAKKQIAAGYHVYLTGCGALSQGHVLDTDTFYHLYSDLQPLSSSLTLLGECPDESLPFVDVSHNVYTKKFIIIQTGCDNHCSFCLTVKKRGNHMSRSREDIVQEINDFVASGGKEIVLTGVNIAAWGCQHSTQPHESQFTDLLQYILDTTTIPRIRLSSLGPEYLHDDFFSVIKNPRILPHFHLSIQSFSDGVLHRMKRNYTAQTLATVLTKFRSLPTTVPVSLGADIIVGFPGETDQEFQETVDGIQTYTINKVHIFPFSDHHIGESIPASSLPHQIESSLKKQRERGLKKIADAIEQQFLLSNKGLTHKVLVEGKGTGWTENYLKVSIDLKHKRGEIVIIDY